MNRPLALCALALILAGCGATTHTVLPPGPPGAGKGAATLGLQWSPGRVSLPSFQMGLYVGVGARGTVGGTITDVLLPSSLSGAVYMPSGEGWLSARAHVQSFLQEQIGPTYEVEGAYDPASGETAVRAGVGLVAMSPLVATIRRGVKDAAPVPPTRLVLTLGADAMPGPGLASVEAHIGLNRALARNEVARQRHVLEALGEELGGLVLDAETVESVEAGGEALFALLTVTLRDGRTLFIASRDPYVDCFGCALSLRRASAYPASPEARAVWVSISGKPQFAFPLAMDVDAVLATWRDHGVLDLRPAPDAADHAASGVPYWHDISFLGGLAGSDQ